MGRTQQVARRLKSERLEGRVLLAAEVIREADVSGLWTDKAPVQGPVQAIETQRPGAQALLSGISPIKAIEFRLLSLDKPTLSNKLASVSGNDSSRTLSLPRPDGTFDSFLVSPSQVMAPELAAQFPLIQTFSGVSDSSNGDRVFLDVSPNGFHAMVLSAEGNYFVDPFYYHDDRLYASYFTAGEFRVPSSLRVNDVSDADDDVGHSHDKLEAEQVVVKDSDNSKTVSATSGTATASRSGSQLRTYRTAVAATGEYTQFFGGSVANGQAAIVTAINRVSGIYESELSIRLELIGNNSSLVYTNANSDPYSNNDAVALLSENQSNIDSVIGSANYDLGHVFGTDGGGLAGLGVVGINGRKAEGETGDPNPINDSFYVDYVAHEIGHQFGGDHTFNGDSGSCAGGNRNGSTAYEPGSGSTIQAYAGICGNDNLQNNSDPYFHSASFDQIIDHVDNVIPTVGTRTATGNSVPTVDGGLDYSIPARTPFTLTAIGNDADPDDVLTYNWEQRDLGPQLDLNASDNGQSPLFRSLTPTTDPTRTLPRLSDLLAGTSTPGEMLPTVSRTMNFRVTARDNRAGGGAVNTDDVQVNVVETGSVFALTSPNAAVIWSALSTQTVTWDVARTDSGSINASQVDILLSTDGGNEFDVVLASAVDNDGSQDIVVPNNATTSARIKIQPVNNIFFDLSDVDFTISEADFADDFGDAPDPYPTLLTDNGPRHSNSSLRLGATVDTESDGQPSASGNGDGSDEDGLTWTEPFVAGETVSFRVDASEAGQLDAFFDFDGNGAFGNNANEILRTSVVAGSNTLSLAIPGLAVQDTFARLRLSTVGNLPPTGPSSDGEVEDYAIKIFDVAPAIDRGDAPATYENVGDEGRHLLGGLILGASADGEVSNPDTQATGDGRDDDGVIFRELLQPGQASSVEVIASAAGVLNYFIDFDGDGTFGNNPDEIFSANVDAGSQSVSFTVPASAATGITFARFRLSSSGGLGPHSIAFDGEVEDYQTIVVDTSGEFLLEGFDDVTAPNLPLDWDSSQLGLAWSTVNTVSDTAPNSAFVPNFDDTSDVRLDSLPISIDEAGTIIRFQNRYEIEQDFDGGVLEVSLDGIEFIDVVEAGGTFLSGGYNGTLELLTSNPLQGREAWTGDSGGFIETALELPADFVGEEIMLRWRIGTDQSVNDPGWWIDTLSITGDSASFDFGDALGTGIPTLSADNGAAHLVDVLAVAPLRLGAAVDVDVDGQPTANADGDDLAGDDEDGVQFPSSLTAGGNDITIVSSGTGIVSLWIDLNGDGAFDSVDEHLIKDVTVNAGSQALPVTLPAGLSTSMVVARVRLSQQAGLAPDGKAGGGEVEDYLVQIGQGVPVAVESVTINDGLDQRSQITSLEVVFDGPTSVSPASFELRSREGNSLTPLQVAAQDVDGKTVATITFLSGANVVDRASGNSLADGNYELTILASGIGDLASDFTFGDVESDAFFRLFGDTDGDRDVDGQDYGRFGLTFLKSSTDPAFNAALDSDGDGDVDGQDYGRFGLRFLTSLRF